MNGQQEKVDQLGKKRRSCGKGLPNWRKKGKRRGNRSCKDRTC